MKHGWDPLCVFLSLPVPAVPFPSATDSDEFKRRNRNVLFLFALAYLVLGLLISSIISWVGNTLLPGYHLNAASMAMATATALFFTYLVLVNNQKM